MDRQCRNIMRGTLRVSRSRRQVLGTAAEGTLGGIGAVLVAQGLGPSLHDDRITPSARAQNGECPPMACPEVANPVVRRNVYSLSDGEVASLRRGVAVMKQRQPSDPTSDSFVGTISLFGLLAPVDHGAEDRGGRRNFNITRAVQAAQARGDWQGEVVVTFVPQGLVPANGATVAPDSELTAAQAQVARGPWITVDRITVTAIE